MGHYSVRACHVLPLVCASLRYVTLGKPSGAEIEVLAGLQGGERLVTKPGELDLNGKRIEAE